MLLDPIEALELAYHALNEIPNTPIRHYKYRNSYEVAAVIGKVITQHKIESGGKKEEGHK